MSHRHLTAAGAVVLMALLSSCSSSDDHATNQFDMAGQRVFEAYRTTGTVTKTVTLPRDVSEFVVWMDCVGTKGFIDVGVAGVRELSGEAGSPCGEASGSFGQVVMSATSGRRVSASTVTLTVTAPRGAEWSAAVDTRPSK